MIEQVSKAIGGPSASNTHLTRMFAGMVEGIPEKLHSEVAQRYADLVDHNTSQSPVFAANQWLRDLSEKKRLYGDHLLADDPQALAETADRYARTASKILANDQTLHGAETYAMQKGVACTWSTICTEQGKRNRLACPRWWRRQLRKVHWQQSEQTERDLGLVSYKAGRYASQSASNRRLKQVRDNQEKLASTNLIDPDGIPIPLLQICQHNTTDKTIRRHETVARIKGMDSHYREQGHACEFWTITAPSRFHATLYSGKPNPKYDGSDPKTTNDYLLAVWANVRIRLSQQKIQIAGLRVAEPHHDGTPHHHYIVYVQQAEAEHVWDMVNRHATEADAYELNTDKKRQARAKRIEIDERGVVGYVLKYVAKNLDGSTANDKHNDQACEMTGHEAAQRVDAWASHWRIRQFAFFGSGAPIALWRQLRAMSELEKNASDTMRQMHEHARSGEHAAYLAIAAQKIPQYIEKIDTKTGEIVQQLKLVARYALECEGTGDLSYYDEHEITKPVSIVDKLTGERLDIPRTEWKIEVNHAARKAIAKTKQWVSQYVTHWEQPDDILIPF